MKAGDLKKGAVVMIDGDTYVVKEVQVKTPSSRGANTLYKVIFRNVVTKQKYDCTFKGEDIVQAVEFSRRAVQVIYRDSESVTVMDNETFEQHNLTNEMLEEELPFLVDDLDGLNLLIANDVALGLELPTSVVMKITDCAPEMKGSSASARSKPATLQTGLVIQVPEYLALGEIVRVNTQTGKFMSRA